ncbi:MAG: energy-coupling factor transporter ATPase [Eubacterium sp.]|jgi:energy-coupling factor transport system ATP-binding protein|nr:energy-coupling factor transporter ATPase [Eubacterium sp.]MCH4046772.1 energy-coupling factor transporter ATPase [Eubacterium sp.]MCH4079869.1 energy-coupling factor transporter ATPase [Eubacterium sp.]MCH4110090.1 energy-coupling factor transporter ATPase [Eubacterium sp.]MCI1306488.1 energy-coupling factor transporter ATPase [Eubacterium sp.]
MSIQVRNLSYIYNAGMPDEQKALDNVSFEVYDGQIAAVIGHTGSGKSTLVQHLNGLLKPTEGTIIVGGTDITESGIAMREIRQRVGLVFQYPEYQLFEETVSADVAFGPKNLGLSESEIKERVREALELVGLDVDEIGERSPFELSGGQKRRVAIAGIIAMRPQVLILDEPTAGLDPGAHREIIRMIQKIHQREENIVIFVSHNMDDVAALSDKVLVMDRGQLMMSGTPAEIFRQRDRLGDAGLDIPSAARLMLQLRKAGCDVPVDALTRDDAADELAEYLQGKSRKC